MVYYSSVRASAPVTSLFGLKGSSSSSSSSSSRIYYFDREGPTDVAVLLQGTLSALYRAKQKRIDAQPDDTSASIFQVGLR